MSKHIGHCWPEKADPHNSGSASRIFFQILQNRRGQEVHESFQKNSCSREIGQFESKNGASS